MRKLLWALSIATPLMAQVSNPSIIPVTVAPSGSCTPGLPNQQVVTTGIQYSCQNGTWAAFSAGGSGTVNSGTANQIGYYAGAGTAISGNSALIKTTADSLFLSDALPSSPGTNNIVHGIQSGANIFHSGSTWFGGNNTLMGMQAGKSLTSAADNTLFGYQAGQSLQGGFSTGCTALASSEEDGIVTAFGENAAVALNTPTSGACEISSDFFGQKAAAGLGTSYNDTFVGTHSGTNGAGVSASTSSVVVGAWAAGGTASTTLTSDVFVGANAAGGGAGGTYAHDVGVGRNALSALDGTVANTADWNTALGDSSGCSITSGRFNTFMGAEAGGYSGNCATHHITGTYNIGIGQQSLYTQGANVTGTSNIVIGNQFSVNPVVTSGNYNVLVGPFGHGVGAAQRITAIGTNWNINANGAEVRNTLLGDSTNTGAGDTGDTAIGGLASAVGGSATAVGYSSNASAIQSTAIGTSSAASASQATSVGYLANASGALATAIGYNSTATQSNALALGEGANATSVNAIELGVGTCGVNQGACVFGKQFFDNNSGGVKTPTYSTTTNCSSSAAPAVCSAAPAGSVVIAAAGTTVTVNTTAVTANSQIFIQEDSSLGTKLSVTCNTTLGRTYAITARTAGTSFTITSSAAPSTNPACMSYSIIN